MSFVFSKNKEKRSRSSTGESNSSFVKNVTSRVSGLLSAGITKWFSSPSSSSGNGSVAVADGTDSSTEDEAPESPSMIQPPLKRIRYSSPLGKYSQLTTSDTTTTSNIVTESGSVLYSSIQSPPGRHTFRRENHFVSTPIRTENNFISTPIGTHTNDSSMNMNMNMMEATDREDTFRQHTVSAVGQSIAQKRKSLFNSQRQREQSLIACAQTAAHQMKDTKLPHFKPHLFGSPFYPGQTMYGGSSSLSTYMNEPYTKQRKLADRIESRDADTVNISTSSRRVMDLLENYSSPLIEAKRIPRYELSELRDITKNIQPNTSTRHSYKTQELYIPSTAALIRMKARNRLMDSTKAARQIIASHSSTLSTYQPYARDKLKADQPDISGPAKAQTKLKSRLTRLNRGEDPFGMPEKVELPTAVLEIDKNNLPKFSFGGSTTNLKSTNNASNDYFKFSSNLPVILDAKTSSSPGQTFSFGSPENVESNTSPPKFSFETKSGEESTKAKQQPDKKDEPVEIQATDKTIQLSVKASNKWNCSVCLVHNAVDAPKCVCCGAKQPLKQTAVTPSVTAAKCTTCKLSNSLLNSDRCANCDKMQINLKPINSLVVTKKTNTWKCGDCWVDNEEKAEKCACCGSRNPKQGISQKPINSLVVTENANKWKCGGCWVDNEEKAEKCVSCGSRNPKQGISQKPINSLVVTENANKWKCGGCWVDNEEKAEKCVCCGSRNPSQDVPTAPLSIKQTVAPVSTEKDWRCEDCMIANKPAIEKCAACGGAKPGTKAATKTLSTASSQFKEANNAMTHIMEAQMSYWECTVCLASNANDKLTCMCCDANRYPQNNSQAKFTNFKFNADSNSGFKFGIDPKIQEINLSKNMDTSQPENTEKFETNNNIVPKVPSYTFTLPAKKPSDNVDSPKIVDTFTLLAKKPSDNITVDSLKSVENPKPSFSFGIPKQTPTPISTGFGLNMAPATKPLDIEKPAEDIERPQEVPSINFTAPEATKPSTGLFSQLPPSKNPQNAMNAFLNVSAEAKKVASSKSPVQPSAVLETPQLQFNFSDSAVKPSTGGLFTSPASTASSNSLTMQSLPASTLVTGMFSKPETTATSVMSFFTKPGTTPTPSTTSEATVRPAMSFFSKPETTSAPSTSLFSNKTQSSPAEPAASTAPNASFSFFPTTSSAPANASTGFKFNFASTTTAPAFGAAPQTITSTFSLPAANLLTNGSTNPLGGNSIPVNNLATTITGNEMDGTNAVASTGNAMLGSDSVSMFSAPAKENASMWPNTTAQTNQPNPFMASAPSKAPFSFGATPAPFPFGATENNAQPLVFGASQQPTQNIFGINQNNASQPMFASSAAPANQPAPMFGSAQPVNSAQPMGMFGAPSSTAFGTSSDSMNTIDESSLPTAPTPAFNFSAAAQSSTVFGFGQQAQQPQMQPAGMQQAGMQQAGMQQAGMQQAGMQQAGMQQAGMQQAGMQQAGMQQAGMQALQQPAMYNFGAAPGPGQMQFNIGTNSARRMRKAVRKCNQR